jgi:hypothetical protein
MMLIGLIVKPLAAVRRRLTSESGFAMVMALGVLMVTSLLVGAIYVGVQAEIQSTSRSSDTQQAYYAARAGEQAFLYQLDENPNYWTTCSNDYAPTPVAVPGTTSGLEYSYVPVYNPGYSNTSCTTSTAIAALIDTNSGTLRVEFTGYAGPTNPSTGVPEISKTLVASFRKPSPLDFLWYTDYETKDPALDSTCQNDKYYWQYTNGAGPPSECQINWVTGDVMDGPSYTNDQYLIYQGNTPTFGRAGTDDVTESSAPEKSVCVNSNCQGATFQGQNPPAQAGAPEVPLPQSVASTQLLADAQANQPNSVFTGTTTIDLTANANGTESATISNCPGSAAATACTTGWVNNTLTNVPPIIYVQSGSGCPTTYSASTYSLNNQGQYYGPCGDVYVHGTYNQPLTIVSDHDVIVVGNTSKTICYTDAAGTPATCEANPGLTTSTDASGNPTGNATVGLVAGDFVRVMHPATNGINTPVPITIDAAILTLQHSFMVDNYASGQNNPQPKLTVHGAIAQRYRGIVGQVGSTGYLKDYHYDDRLKVILPPYLFSISTAGWVISRETLCMPDTPATDSSSCAYQGT